MTDKVPLPTKRPRERAILVGVEIFGEERSLSVTDSLEELASLSLTAGLDVVFRTSQKLDHPNPRTFIGQGKVKEIAALAKEFQANVILFDEELSPRHQRELERIFDEDARIIDRTVLILDIFAQHAATREGSLQVELAQYEYRLPRLTRAWTHLARQAGGGGGRAGGVGGVGLRGPGETQIEADRREINRRITTLKKDIEKVRRHRHQYRLRRKRSNIPVVALVGYTNAGKSTLINYLTESDVYVANKLFATLDPTTRRVDLPCGRSALFTDTVGFIQKLPTTLVAAFHATLEEISEADILLHVVDITHQNFMAQADVVDSTLTSIGAGHIPVITALNKIDLLANPGSTSRILDDFQNSVSISALKGYGIDDLLDLTSNNLYKNFIPIAVTLPYEMGKLINVFHNQGSVEEIKHKTEGVFITGRLPGRLIAQFKPYEI